MTRSPFSIWRSREPSRLEGFSDAVFGFALTLLVVSLEVPRTIDDLFAVMRGFLPFAFTFATVTWIWYEHYVVFRKFDPSDRVTVLLNSALLFLVMFYVYPLKFLFTLVVGVFLGAVRFSDVFHSQGDSVKLMTIYGLGYFVVFATLALLYFNVWKRRRAMDLNEQEVFEARWGFYGHLATGSVGLLSVAIMLIGGDEAGPYAGFAYAALGIVRPGVRVAMERRRSRLAVPPGA